MIDCDDDLIMDPIETDSDFDDDQYSMDIGMDNEEDDRIVDPAPYVAQTRYGRHLDGILEFISNEVSIFIILTVYMVSHGVLLHGITWCVITWYYMVCYYMVYFKF